MPLFFISDLYGLSKYVDLIHTMVKITMALLLVTILLSVSILLLCLLMHLGFDAAGVLLFHVLALWKIVSFVFQA